MALTKYLHDHKIELSITSIVMGGLIIILTMGGVMASSDSDGIFTSIKDFFDNWIYWVMILGTGFLLIGLFYFLDFIVKRKEFYKLFDEKSKSKFIKNQDRIEELAWRLHPKYEEMVIDRKKEFRIK